MYEAAGYHWFLEINYFTLVLAESAKEKSRFTTLRISVPRAQKKNPGFYPGFYWMQNDY